MNPMTRRELFGWTAGAIAAGSANLASHRLAMAIPPFARSRPSHMKLSLAAYSYRDYLTGKKSPKLDLFDFVNLAADMALDGVEPTSYYFPPDVTSDYLDRLKLHAFSLGLDISGTAVGNNFCLPPGPKRDEQITLVERWIDNAAELDAPVIRIFAGNVAKRIDRGTGGCLGHRRYQKRAPLCRQKGDRAGSRESRRDHRDTRTDLETGRARLIHPTSA